MLNIVNGVDRNRDSFARDLDFETFTLLEGIG